MSLGSKVAGQQGFKCYNCKLSVTGGHYGKAMTNEARPCCVRCRRFMSISVSRNKRNFTCNLCGVAAVSHCSRKRQRRRTRTGEKLINIATRALPANLPAEIREEARQAIIIDLLARKVKRNDLTDPRLIRRYVRAAYGLNDSYRFISLDAPLVDDDGTLGGLIAA